VHNASQILVAYLRYLLWRLLLQRLDQRLEMISSLNQQQRSPQYRSDCTRTPTRIHFRRLVILRVDIRHSVAYRERMATHLSK
jgi:hypothetical protein